MTIANRLNALCKERKIAKVLLAEKIGVPQSTLQTWIARGEDFPAKYLIPICNVLGVSVEALLLGDDAPASKTNGFTPLSEEESFLLDSYRLLDREGKVVVSGTVVNELRRVRAASEQE